MNFYGPKLGDDLNDLARRMVDRLATGTAPASMNEMVAENFVPRLGLAAMLVVGLVGVRRARPEVASLIRRSGFVAVGLALASCLAFLVDPVLVDWAGFGLPYWARLLGIPVGAYALAGATRRAPGRAAFLLGTAGALLAANWVVALMVARGLVLGKLADGPGPMPPAPTLAAPLGVAGHQS